MSSHDLVNEFSPNRKGITNKFLLVVFLFFMIVVTVEAVFYYWLSKNRDAILPEERSDQVVETPLKVEFHTVSDQNSSGKSYENYTGIIAKKEQVGYILQNIDNPSENITFILAEDAQVVFFDRKGTVFGAEEFSNQVEIGAKITVSSVEGLIKQLDDNKFIVNRVFVGTYK